MNEEGGKNAIVHPGASRSLRHHARRSKPLKKKISGRRRRVIDRGVTSIHTDTHRHTQTHTDTHRNTQKHTTSLMTSEASA